jgi:hypothetical protein
VDLESSILSLQFLSLQFPLQFRHGRSVLASVVRAAGRHRARRAFGSGNRSIKRKHCWIVGPRILDGHSAAALAIFGRMEMQNGLMYTRIKSCVMMDAPVSELKGMPRLRK